MKKSATLAHSRLLSLSGEFFEILNTPRSLACWILLKNNEFSQLVNLKCSPSHYLNAEAFSKDYQATKLLSKYSGFRHPELDPRAKALESFSEAEDLCRETNDRIRSMIRDQTVPAWITRVQERISRILGTFDSSIIDEVSFSPGGTIGVTRADASPFTKMKGPISIGSELYSILGGRGDPFFEGAELEPVIGNEHYLVPKNAKTHRSIFKEPTIDAVVQRQIGTRIRTRLRRNGCDLLDQSRNQALARFSDGPRPVATIDLKAASDTISYELVRLLLPTRWFLALDSVRSPSTIVDGKPLRFEKFSSMGNGYTFELESLIFWAVAKATVPFEDWDLVSVYGDDIIVPAHSSSKLIERLLFLGFQTNVDKTFVDGPFRESCGFDYFNGVLVTPIYIKDPLHGNKEIISFCNRLYLKSNPFNHCWDHYHDPFKALHSRLVRWLHPGIARNPVPRIFGDAGLIGPCHPGNDNIRFNRTSWTWEVRVRVQSPMARKWNGDSPSAFLRDKLVRNGSINRLLATRRLDSTIQDREALYESFLTSSPKLRFSLKWCSVAELN